MTTHSYEHYLAINNAHKALSVARDREDAATARLDAALKALEEAEREAAIAGRLKRHCMDVLNDLARHRSHCGGC